MEKILEKKIKHVLSPTQYNIANYLLKHGAKVRKELENDLNIPHTTAYDNLKKLEDKNIVCRIPIQNGKRGRPFVNWQIKQAHNLILFKEQNLKLVDKQVLPVLTNKPKKNKKSLKHGKLPTIERKIMLDEVKYLTYTLNKLENSKLTKQRKAFNNNPATSYILNNKNSELTKYILDEINKYTYFRTSTLRNNYLSTSLKDKYSNVQEKIRRSVSNRIGRIVRELNNLNIIVKYSESIRTVWKNLYKDNLYNILDEKMEQKYFMLKMKKMKNNEKSNKYKQTRSIRK